MTAPEDDRRALRDELAMSVEEFLAFTDTRPDEERWELIDGEPIMNPSPSYGHQKVVGTLFFLLKDAEKPDSPWEVLPGLGVKLSERSMPVPDVIIRPAISISGHYCDDMIAAFEVLSPSSRQRDLRWKRLAYSTLPSLQHYVVLHQARAQIHVYDRATGWTEERLTGPDAVLRLRTLDLAFAARALYAGTGLI